MVCSRVIVTRTPRCHTLPLGSVYHTAGYVPSSAFPYVLPRIGSTAVLVLVVLTGLFCPTLPVTFCPFARLCIAPHTCLPRCCGCLVGYHYRGYYTFCLHYRVATHVLPVLPFAVHLTARLRWILYSCGWLVIWLPFPLHTCVWLRFPTYLCRLPRGLRLRLVYILRLDSYGYVYRYALHFTTHAVWLFGSFALCVLRLVGCLWVVTHGWLPILHYHVVTAPHGYAVWIHGLRVCRFVYAVATLPVAVALVRYMPHRGSRLLLRSRSALRLVCCCYGLCRCLPHCRCVWLRAVLVTFAIGLVLVDSRSVAFYTTHAGLRFVLYLIHRYRYTYVCSPHTFTFGSWFVILRFVRFIRAVITRFIYRYGLRFCAYAPAFWLHARATAYLVATHCLRFTARLRFWLPRCGYIRRFTPLPLRGWFHLRFYVTGCGSRRTLRIFAPRLVGSATRFWLLHTTTVPVPATFPFVVTLLRLRTLHIWLPVLVRVYAFAVTPTYRYWLPRCYIYVTHTFTTPLPVCHCRCYTVTTVCPIRLVSYALRYLPHGLPLLVNTVYALGCLRLVAFTLHYGYRRSRGYVTVTHSGWLRGLIQLDYSSLFLPLPRFSSHSSTQLRFYRTTRLRYTFRYLRSVG